MHHVRTDDAGIRAQQWARMSSCTRAISIELDLARKLQAYLAASRAYQTVVWYYPQTDPALMRDLARMIHQAEERLTTTNETISSLNSELIDLHVALNGGGDTI